jgi:hypothetical protein
VSVKRPKPMGGQSPKHADGTAPAGEKRKPGPLSLEQLTLADLDAAAARAADKLRFKPHGWPSSKSSGASAA